MYIWLHFVFAQVACQTNIRSQRLTIDHNCATIHSVEFAHITITVRYKCRIQKSLSKNKPERQFYKHGISAAHFSIELTKMHGTHLPIRMSMKFQLCEFIHVEM